LKHCRGSTKTLRQRGGAMPCRHGARLHRCRRGDPAADAAAALRLSGRLALAAQSGAGAGTAAGAGAAAGTAQNIGPTAPASPAAPGIAAGNPADDPAAWGHAARPRTAGNNLEDHPALPTATRAASPRFSDRTCACQVRGTGVEPFGFHPDIFLPGTLHHSGNKPAPPSDHIPLERRSAFWSAR